MILYPPNKAVLLKVGRAGSVVYKVNKDPTDREICYRNSWCQRLSFWKLSLLPDSGHSFSVTFLGRAAHLTGGDSGLVPCLFQVELTKWVTVKLEPYMLMVVQKLTVVWPQEITQGVMMSDLPVPKPIFLILMGVGAGEMKVFTSCVAYKEST